jgi:predicted TPR repeat methyltransferase
VTQTPDAAPLAAAIRAHRAGDFASAERAYRAQLQQSPEDPSALHFLGLLRNQQGRNPEALTLMLRALEADPEYVDAWSNLGIVFIEEQDFARAEKCCRRALELAPEFVNAWANLGMALRARNALEEALAAWSRALELAPTMRSIAIPYGQLLYRLNRIEEAAEFYRRWSTVSPEDPVPAHMLAASGGSGAPTRASDAYVRMMFDDFASTFDRNLERLQYRAPQLLEEALHASRWLRERQIRDALDLGCGTGLCGPWLRPLARRLVGVDLSHQMLSRAAARGLYDQLNCAELTAWLAASQESFDLVVAADVLCYFGDLGPPLRGLRSALSARGLVAFTLEHTAEASAGSDFVLRPHGRYQHELTYVKSVLAAAALEPIALSQPTLRYERNEAVCGILVLATTAQD